MENHKWKDAAALDFAPAGFPWDKYPWQKGIIHFARLMGKANTNDIKGAEEELGELQALREEVMKQKDDYKAKQLEIQMKAGEAWIYFKRKNHGRAIELAINAADLEDATEKHPVTPGEVIPARELLADLYMAMEDYTHALEHYEADMKKHPNRFNALYNAGRASEKLGDVQKAGMYYSKLLTMAVPGTNRPELQAAKRFTENKEVAKL
jgi:tetratricopeptide (TPR) repeat protein